MKRSRSGTRSSKAKPPRRPAFGLALALLAVLAFIASFIFGLGRGRDQRPAPSPALPPSPLAVPDSRVRIEVFNGSGKSGRARLATDRLRDAGYDVVHLGNARSAAATSRVIDRVGERAIAEKVAQVLGIAKVETVVDTSRYLEVTVILGADWRAKTGAQP